MVDLTALAWRARSCPRPHRGPSENHLISQRASAAADTRCPFRCGDRDSHARWRENDRARKAQREQSEQSKRSVGRPELFLHSARITDSRTVRSPD